MTETFQSKFLFHLSDFSNNRNSIKLHKNVSGTLFFLCVPLNRALYTGGSGIFVLVDLFLFFSPDNTPLRSSLVAEANVVELFRDDPEEELGLRIVGGKDTPLGNIVIQEIIRDSIASRDGRLAPGDHILEVRQRKVMGLCFPPYQVSLLQQTDHENLGFFLHFYTQHNIFRVLLSSPTFLYI